MSEVRDPHGGKHDAEIHRRKMMSQDERNMLARDQIAKDLKESAERTGDTKSTYESFHKKATEIADKVERQK